MHENAKWPLALTLLLGLVIPGIGWAAATVDDAYSTPNNTTLTVSAPGILGNDDCDVCAVVSVEGLAFEGQISFGPPVEGQDPRPELPSGASLTVSSDGSFTYDPGTLADPTLPSDSFTYQAQDSRGLSATATVTVTLTEPPASSAPVANDDQYSVELGSALTVPAPGILGNDTDADGDPLTVALVNGAEPTFGSSIPLTSGDLTLQADGSFTYTPSPGASAGVDEGFSYTASDGTSSSNTAFVSITLQQPTTGDTTVTVSFADVGEVALAAEIGRSEVDHLEIAAAFGTMAQVGGAGLPPQAGALVLRNSDSTKTADAKDLLGACERMALLAQAQPTKYDLVVRIQTAAPGTAFSQGPDGEVIVELPETWVRCSTTRSSS